jgi:hypothetical protein
MNRLSIIIVSLLLGAASWAICPLVSDRFEPFDTGLGYLIGQFVMVILTAYVGWTTNAKNVILSVAGLYLSQNTYAYVFGTSEAKAWAILLLVTSIELCILPLIGGLAARGINVFVQRQAKNI